MSLKIKIATLFIIACFSFQTCIIAEGFPVGQNIVEKSITFSVSKFQGSFSIPGRGEYTSTIYYPGNSSGKPYPVIVFAHGFCSCSEWHTWIGNCLASKGYLVLLFTVPNRTSTNVLQWVDGIEGGISYLQQLNDESSQFRGMMNMSRLGIMGHSMGGMATIIAASSDSRIKVAVSLAAPYLGNTSFGDQYTDAFRSMIDWDSVLSASRTITIPIQFQVGTRDAFAANNTKIYFEAANSSVKEFVTIEGGNHVQFIDDANILSYSTLSSVFSMLLSMTPETLWIFLQYMAPKILQILFQKTLTGVGVGLGIDLPATITPQEQQEISSKNFLNFFNLYL